MRDVAKRVIIFGGAHLALNVMLWGQAIATGDSGERVPLALQAAVMVFGTPLMHLMYLGPEAFTIGGNRWWGDDSNFLLMLAAANSLIWGAVLAALGSLWTRRRARAA